MKSYLMTLKESTISDLSRIKKYMNAASAVIYRVDENGTRQVLLIQRAKEDHWPNHWELPRGKCDQGKNENTVHCVRREVKEETGLDVEVVALIDTFQYLAHAGKRMTTCFNYLCKMKNPNQKVKISHEHQDFKWISEIGQVELLILPDQKKTIERVLNSDRSLVTYPDNKFTVNNKLDEYLNRIQ